MSAIIFFAYMWYETGRESRKELKRMNKYKTNKK